MGLWFYLVSWTGGDPDRMDRLFRDSGLMRGKWDKVHLANGAKYGEVCLSRTLLQVNDYYSPPAKESESDDSAFAWAHSDGEPAVKSNLTAADTTDVRAVEDAKRLASKVVVKGFSSDYQTIVSVATLTEFRETLLKYPDRLGLDEDDVQQEIETIRYFAEFVDPAEDITAVEADPDDDHLLEAAVAGNVDYIVSGDQHLLDRGSFRSIDIVDPRMFYEHLEAA